MDFIDISDTKKEKDKFMIGIYVSLIVLVVFGLLIYFFGYNFFAPYITI